MPELFHHRTHRRAAGGQGRGGAATQIAKTGGL